MRATDRDDDAHFSQVEVADAMDERNLEDRPARTRLGLELRHLGERHLGIGLVIERGGPAVAGHLADGARNVQTAPARFDRTRSVAAGVVDRGLGDRDHREILESSRQPPPPLRRSPEG